MKEIHKKIILNNSKFVDKSINKNDFNFNMTKKGFLIFLFVIFLVFCFFRFYNLDTLAIFNDEAIYLNWAQSIEKDFSQNKFISLSDGKPFLHYWLLVPGLKVFNQPLYAGRLTSGITAILGFILICVLSYILFKSFLITILTASFYSVLPFLVVYQRMVLVDVFVSILGVLIFIFSWFFTKKEIKNYNDWAKKIIYFIFLTGLFLIGAILKQTSFLFLGAAILSLNVFAWKNNSSIKNWLIVNFGIVFSFFISYFSFKLIIPEKYKFIFLNKAGSFFSFNIFSNIGKNAQVLIETLGFYITPIVVFLLIWPLLTKKALNNKKKTKLYWLYFWGIAPFLFFTLFAKTLYTRFFLIGVPYLIILAGYSFKNILNRFQKKYIISLLILMVFILPLAQSFLRVTQPLNFFWTKVDNKNFINFWSSGFALNNIKSFLQKHGKNNQLMFLNVYDLGFPMDYFKLYQNEFPNIKLTEINSSFINTIQKAKEIEKVKPILLLLNPDRRKNHKYLEESDICKNKKIFYQPAKTSHYTLCLIY